ncbi:hypothetical protein ACWED2_10025 [Amycolatopsis sp. NPDC005003]
MERTRELAPIPPTVWATGLDPIDLAATWPVPIVRSITMSFSASGARVLIAPWPTFGTAGGRELAVVRDAVCTLGRDAVVAELVAAAHTPAGGGGAHGLAAPMQQAMRDGGASPQTRDRARADLIITVLPANNEGDESAEAFAIAAARVLVFGGILAVYTHTDWSTGRLIDRSGAMIAAAQNADLLYLQHIVTLNTPIRNGRVQPPPGPVGPVHDDVGDRAPQIGAAAMHTRVHGDVFIFAQAHADAAGLR